MLLGTLQLLVRLSKLADCNISAIPRNKGRGVDLSPDAPVQSTPVVAQAAVSSHIFLEVIDYNEKPF